MFSYGWSSNGRDSSSAPNSRRKRNYSSSPLCFSTGDSTYPSSSWSKQSLLLLPQSLWGDYCSTSLEMMCRTCQDLDTQSALLFLECPGNDTNQGWDFGHILFFPGHGGFPLYQHRAERCWVGIHQLNGRKSNKLNLQCCRFVNFEQIKHLVSYKKIKFSYWSLFSYMLIWYFPAGTKKFASTHTACHLLSTSVSVKRNFQAGVQTDRQRDI